MQNKVIVILGIKDVNYLADKTLCGIFSKNVSIASCFGF